MQIQPMQVEILLPAEKFFSCQASKVYAVADNGAFGLLPNHSDLVASLVSSVLVITDTNNQELYFGIDQGLLIKNNKKVEIAVRRALQGKDLASLAAEIDEYFSALDDAEKQARTAISKLEAGIVRQLNKL